MCLSLESFFFFQAEDGIRDRTVTGVQTCALPIFSSTHYLATTAGLEILKAGGNAADAGVAAGLCINVLEPHLTNLGGVAPIMHYERSEERRVGKECTGRWWTEQSKKKQQTRE